MLKYLSAVLSLAFSTAAFGQSTVLQGGPWTQAHVPQYTNQGSTSQPIISDGGGAGGGGIGINPSEIGITARGTGTPPYAGQGKGPLGTNVCDYDAPVTGNHHYLCFSANAQGGGLIAFGAAGAPTSQLSMIINGSTYPFPFVLPGTGVIGPTSPPTVIGHLAIWNNTAGTLLADEQYATLAQGGLGGSQIAATAGQIPVYPGSGGAAIPTTALPSFSVTYFGAKCDNSTDDATALQAAVTYAFANNVAISFPNSHFCVSSAQLTGSNGSITIQGSGPQTGVRFTTAGAAGFAFTLRGYVSGQVDRVTLANFKIVASAVHTGAAIKAAWATYTANAELAVNIQNVVVGPDTFGTNKFARGLWIDSAFNGYITNFSFIGATTLADAGIYTNHSIGFNIINPNVTYAASGLHFTTGDSGAQVQSEGMTVVGGTLYNVTTGVLADGTSSGSFTNLGLRIVDTHISATAIDINCVACAQAYIDGGLFYTNATITPAAISFSDSYFNQITNNQIISLVAPVAGKVGIYFTGASSNNVITGNTVAAYDTGLTFNSVNSTGNMYANNQFQTVNTPVTDNGTPVSFGPNNCVTVPGSITSCSTVGGPNQINNVTIGAIVPLAGTFQALGGTNITASGSLIFGSSGTYAAGVIYSDANWGVIIRAKQASPSVGDFSMHDASDNTLGNFTRGHVFFGAGANGATSVGTCGTSPSIVGNDIQGTVTVGTGTPTACTITFAKAYLATAPNCVLGSNPQVAAFSWVAGLTTIVVTQTATSSNQITYHCDASTASG